MAADAAYIDVDMATRSLPVINYEAQRMMEDAAARGWTVKDLAREAHVSLRTAYRFLGGEVQTIPAGRALAHALGHSLKVYIRNSRRAAA